MFFAAEETAVGMKAAPPPPFLCKYAGVVIRGVHARLRVSFELVRQRGGAADAITGSNNIAHNKVYDEGTGNTYC